MPIAFIDFDGQLFYKDKFVSYLTIQCCGVKYKYYIENDDGFKDEGFI